MFSNVNGVSSNLIEGESSSNLLPVRTSSMIELNEINKSDEEFKVEIVTESSEGSQSGCSLKQLNSDSYLLECAQANAIRRSINFAGMTFPTKLDFSPRKN